MMFTFTYAAQYCENTWDGVSCWPRTESNQYSIIPCFKEFNGLIYNTTKNATRLCQKNAVWADKANYSECKPIFPKEEDVLKNLWSANDASKIYFIGYILSLVFLIIALWIFIYFKELRCMRNRIHTNLIITYILVDITWLTAATLQLDPLSNRISSGTQCVLFFLLTYLMGTNYFWMFVEGLYLYLLVMQTFSVEKIHLTCYSFIGWGLPAFSIFIWFPLKYYYGKSNDAMSCKWSERDTLDYIFIVPILIVLMINIFFMGVTIYVLITKLRVTNSAESQQYQKAAKALLVLIPLLGVTYILLLFTPQEGTVKVVITNLQALLYSTQGLSVAVLYCFLNGEVKTCIRNHVERWKSLRILYSQQNLQRNNCKNKYSASSSNALPKSIRNDTESDITTSLLIKQNEIKNKVVHPFKLKQQEIVLKKYKNKKIKLKQNLLDLDKINFNQEFVQMNHPSFRRWKSWKKKSNAFNQKENGFKENNHLKPKILVETNYMSDQQYSPV